MRNIAQVIKNENAGFEYNPSTLDNDFVILKLDSPLTLNDDVKPACLPTSSDYLDVSSTEERCFTSGWGTLSSGGSATDTCQYVRVPAITNAACNSAYGGSITDSMICAGYPGVGEKDACQGDSGGPFVCNDGGKAVVAGVVSWGNGCALADYPGVYARTTYVLDWIKSQMGSSGTPPGPTTAPPPTTCGSPQWANDQWCDDENNNADCTWDGGACCNNDFSGWDTYCTACECLEGGTTTEAPAPTTTQAPSPPTTQGPTECADMPQFMLDANRIVGGEAAPSPIPWQVSVRSGTWHFCGATILDASTLLSAAHCFYQSSANGKSIRAGSIQKSSGGQVRNIAQIIWNTNSGYSYNPSTLDNDFVILKLDSPLELNDDVKPACLPSSAGYLDVSSSEDRCFTSGWGTLSSGGSSPEICQYVRVPAITNAD